MRADRLKLCLLGGFGSLALYSLNVVASFRSRCVTWRGITYFIAKSGPVRVVRRGKDPASVPQATATSEVKVPCRGGEQALAAGSFLDSKRAESVEMESSAHTVPDGVSVFRRYWKT